MAHQNEEMVRRGYKAFSEGDMATLGELMAPDVVVNVPGNNLISGVFSGREAVFARYGKLFALTDRTNRAELEDVQVDGEHRVVATHHATAQRGGKSLDVRQKLAFTIQDGKIVRIDESSSDQAAQDAFWV
jgi:ketosteroid isomerase-like protein